MLENGCLPMPTESIWQTLLNMDPTQILHPFPHRLTVIVAGAQDLETGPHYFNAAGLVIYLLQSDTHPVREKACTPSRSALPRRHGTFYASSHAGLTPATLFNPVIQEAALPRARLSRVTVLRRRRAEKGAGLMVYVALQYRLCHTVANISLGWNGADLRQIRAHLRQ